MRCNTLDDLHELLREEMGRCLKLYGIYNASITTGDKEKWMLEGRMEVLNGIMRVLPFPKGKPMKLPEDDSEG